MKDLNYPVIIGLVLSIGTFMWTVYQYIDTRRREQNLKEFENYHKLIKELVQPETNDVMYVDRQTAILYELRHFKRYYEISFRTVVGLKNKWAQVPNQFPRLLEECDLTIDYLKARID